MSFTSCVRVFVSEDKEKINQWDLWGRMTKMVMEYLFYPIHVCERVCVFAVTQNRN